MTVIKNSFVLVYTTKLDEQYLLDNGAPPMQFKSQLLYSLATHCLATLLICSKNYGKAFNKDIVVSSTAMHLTVMIS